MLDVQRSNATSRLSAMNAATAQVLTLTAPGPHATDQNAVGAAVAAISVSLADLARDVLAIAGLNPDESGHLTHAALKLCTAFAEFLTHVEPENSEPRQSMFGAVGRIGEAGNELVMQLGSGEQESTCVGLVRLV